MNSIRCRFRSKCLIILAVFGSTVSIYTPNQIDSTPKAYTTGIKVKSSHYKAVSEPYYHSNYSKVYVHNKNYTSSLLDDTGTDSHSQTSHVYPVYISEEKKEKIKNVLKEYNTNVVEKDTLNNRVVYKRRIEKSKNIEVFNTCPKGISGQFVYDLACNQYLDCWNGRGGPRNCAPGTLFNPKTLECDYPQKVECLTGFSGSSLTLQRSAKLQASPEQAKCPEDFSGLIPNYTDCSKFIQCNNGIQTPRDCPPGTLFDTNLNVCNHADQTTCFEGQSNAGKEESGVSTTGTYYGGHASQDGKFAEIKGQTQGHYGQYTDQSLQYQGQVNAQTGQQGQTGQHWHPHGYTAGQDPSKQFYGQSNQLGSHQTYGRQYSQTSGSEGSGTSGCDPTNPYCQSGGYIISGHNIYYVYPQVPQSSPVDISYGVPGTLIGAHPIENSGGSPSQVTPGCNPQIQNCGTSGYPAVSYGQVSGSHGKSRQRCNPQYQECGQGFQGTINQYQGQFASSVSSGSQFSGSQSKPSQPCNPQYQECTQNAGGTYYIVDCMPHLQNCSSTVTYQGSNRPVASSYNLRGTQGTGNSFGTNTYEQTPTQGGYSGYQGQYSPSTNVPGSQISGSHGKSDQPCNPQYQECTQNAGGTYIVDCIPHLQNCSSTVTYQGSNRPGASSYNLRGTPETGNSFGTNTYEQAPAQGGYLGYQGQYSHSTAPVSQISGSHGKSGQPCNPQYQECPGRSGNIHTASCNPQFQNCGGVLYQGQNRPGISSGNQVHGSQGTESNYGTHSFPGPPRFFNGTTNYKKICNAGDVNCYRHRPGSQNKKGTEAKCPIDFQGMTKHPTNCKKFLNCANGITYIQDCGAGTVFNPILKICDFPYNVDCKDQEDENSTADYGQDIDNQGEQGPYDKIKVSGYPECPGCPGNQGFDSQDHSQNQGRLPISPNLPQYGQGVHGQPGCQGSRCNQTQGYSGCQGQACQSQSSCQGSHCSGAGGYNNHEGQERLPGSFNQGQFGQGQGTYVQGQGTYGQKKSTYGQSGCQDSQCRQGQEATTITPGRGCQGSQCQTAHMHQGYATSSPHQVQSGHIGPATCQGHQCYPSQGQRRLDGQIQPEDFGQGPESFNPTTAGSHSPTRHQGQDTSENIQKIPMRPGRQGIQPINKHDRTTAGGFNNQKSIDYVDIFDPNESRNLAYATTTRNPPIKPERQVWPPPFPDLATTDLNADYVFEYEDGEAVTLAPENVYHVVENKRKSKCGVNDFMCDKRNCVANNFVCDGERDCSDGKDEKYCQKYMDEFKPYKNSRLDVLEKQRWNNVTRETCALLCMSITEFSCKSFNYRKEDRACFLTNDNLGSSGALKNNHLCDFYERKGTSMDCSDMHKCPSGRCLTSEEICDGYDDCGDRADEKDCRAEDFGYSVKLAAGEGSHEGRIEVTALGKTGYICDDQFKITDANVLCKELGFDLGALEVKGNSYFAKDLKEKNTLYMMDDIRCRGNETSIMQCNFAGWGIHNCADGEIAGVICKTPQETCSEGYWKCDTSNECVSFNFMCDDIFDCTDNSDEASHHCESSTELRLVNGTTANDGRLEIRHLGIWGSVCDDDFNEDAAKIACDALGFSGSAIVKKDAYFGKSTGPIWLDQVSCKGNESSLEKCTHWNWGEHNCDHSEDVGLICGNTIFEVDPKRNSKNYGGEANGSIKDLDNSNSSPEPVSCGYRKDNIFLQQDDVHFRVVQGSVANPGDYPWQAALRIQGRDKSAHWCGAVVIASKWVLTAAHCLEGYPKGSFVVVAGEYNIDEEEGTEQQVFIEEYYLHENFRKGHKMGHDIAMVLLKGSGFKLNQDIQPICLPDINADYERELNCTISGFGTVQTGKSAYSHKLRAAWIPVQKMDVCKMAHIYGENIGEGMICAGDLTGGVDACDGDSGGPLACLDDGVFTLYGLTSWGQRCGYANKPGVYVKVSYYKTWIDHIMTLHSQVK